MTRRAARLLILLWACLLTACGSDETAPAGAGTAPTASIVLRHTLFRGVPVPVDDYRISGLDASGATVFGPVTLTKDDELILSGVPITVVTLFLEYLDVQNPVLVVGTSRVPVQLTPLDTELVENPPIQLLVSYTTLTLTMQPGTPSDKGYVKLSYGPGWPTVVRTDLGTAAQAGRESRRVALACIAQISDVHVVDSESPLRVEYLRGEPGNSIVKQQDFQGAFRAQETLTTHVADAMVRQLNQLGLGPVSGRPFDCLVSTGDNGDNRQANETHWFISLLDGGTIHPSSGNPDLYEGVQDTTANPFFSTYYHPDAISRDIYKDVYGFPDYPGMLEASTASFQAVGSRFPWYTVYGNHDNLVLGNLPTRAEETPTNALDGIVTGTQKNLAMPGFYTGNVLGFLIDFYDLFGFWPQFIAREPARMTSSSTAHRTVTADATRRFLTPQEWAQAHFDGAPLPGPVGHGL
ncbi:MAG: hypothetical protein AB1758_37985, partial [Candidatus Eremiobacterota bacterium]